MARSSLSTFFCLGLAGLALAACGGGGDDGVVTPIVDAAIDAPIDAAPPVCSMTMCGTECVDTTSDENYCGNCTTACTAGQVCNASHCACPPGFVPANPTFVQQQVSTQFVQGATLGFGGMFNNTIDALVVGYPTADTNTGVNITLTGSQDFTMNPIIAAGYDLDTSSFTPAASFFATSGTVRFTKKCDVSGSLGFAGTLTNATFVAVEGLMNPTPVPGGCSFHVDSVTFAFGAACP